MVNLHPDQTVHPRYGHRLNYILIPADSVKSGVELALTTAEAKLGRYSWICADYSFF
jgi:hypothetical protein